MRDFLRNPLQLLAWLGRGTLFLGQILAALPKIFWRVDWIAPQMYGLGVKTVWLVVLSGLFVGMVLALQMFPTLAKFGAEDTIGLLVALALVKELGPVVTALLFAGRAGSAVTAEIGLMRTTEQWAALEMMAVDPQERIVAPRFLAGIVSLPLLVAIFTLVGIGGGYLVSIFLFGVEPSAFWSQMDGRIGFEEDVLGGWLKALVFGWAVMWIALFEGRETELTAGGVGQATTRTVVFSAFAVFGLDLLLTVWMFEGM